MGNLKISFSSAFFSEKTKRTRGQLVSHNDIVCKHLSDVYCQAKSELAAPIHFDDQDAAEIARKNTYNIILGENMQTVSLPSFRAALQKKGVYVKAEQDAILVCLLQTKLGVQYAVAMQMTVAVIALSQEQAYIDNKKITVDYRRIRRETIIKFNADIVIYDNKKIGYCEFTICLRKKQLSLKNFDMTIFETAPEKKIFEHQVKYFNQDTESHPITAASTVTPPNKSKIKPIKPGIFRRIFSFISSIFNQTKTIFIMPVAPSYCIQPSRQYVAVFNKMVKPATEAKSTATATALNHFATTPVSAKQQEHISGVQSDPVLMHQKEAQMRQIKIHEQSITASFHAHQDSVQQYQAQWLPIDMPALTSSYSEDVGGVSALCQP